MHTLYSMQNSGNCYKLRLAMAQLGIPFQIHDVDILKGESRTPEFLALNPNGKVPALRLETGELLSESNAILFFLAEDTPLMPEGKFCRAEVLQWMFFEQYSHEPYIAVARFWLKLMKGGRELKRDMLDDWWERGYRHSASWSGTWKPKSSSPQASTPSPTSRFMPTPTWLATASSTFRTSRAQTPGWSGCVRSQAMSQWTGGRNGN